MGLLTLFFIQKKVKHGKKFLTVYYVNELVTPECIVMN